MEHTTKESIENTVIGRDNVEDFDFTAKTVRLPAVSVTVAGQPETFVGHFSLRAEAGSRETDPFSPVQVKVSLEGYGNLDRLTDFNLSVPGATVFTDGLQRRYRLDDEGFRGTLTQQFAVVADGNFTIPPFSLRYYDTVKRKVVVLKTPAIPVTVRPLPRPETLLDAPGPEAERDGIGWGWLNVLLAFVAGVAVGRYLLTDPEEEERRTPLKKRLRRCKDPAKFAAYLAMADVDAYAETIEAIETRLRRGEKVDLKAYRKTLGL
jgi:hypothetical protein